jgi:hypothetical protein
MTNLTEQDLKRIEAIEAYLKNLSTILPIITNCKKEFTPYQPIDTTEGYYVRCTSWQGELYTAGKIYQVVNGIIIDNTGFKDDYAHLIKHQPFFKPATHAEFLAQEQGKEWKPKVGEWVKDEIGNCGLVIEILKNGDLRVDNQSPYGGLITIGTIYVYQPTTEEIQAHLVVIAEKKYPVGTKFKNAVSNKEIGITDGDYEYSKENNALYTKDKPNKVSQCIWYNGKWAELAPIETEQRWQPKLLEDYYYINDWFKVRKTIYTHHDLDRPRILAGNCFKTEQEAQKAAEAIKQYLSTNRF